MCLFLQSILCSNFLFVFLKVDDLKVMISTLTNSSIDIVSKYNDKEIDNVEVML